MRPRRAQRGLAIVTFSMAAAVVIPFLGLAMDGAMLFVIKERLITAVDSAANAAGHYPGQAARMESAATRFLDANFPQGYMGTGTRTVRVRDNRVEVRVEAPTFFMKLIHVKNVEVVAAQRVEVR